MEEYRSGNLYISAGVVYDCWGWLAKVRNNYLMYSPCRELDKDYKNIISSFVEEAKKNGYNVE